MKYIMYAVLAFFTLLLLGVAVSDLIDFFSVPNDFVFGSEVGGFKYSSKTNFLIFNSCQLLFGVLVAFLVLRKVFKLKQSSEKKRL